MGATTTAKFQAKRFDVTDKDLGDLLLHTLRGKIYESILQIEANVFALNQKIDAKQKKRTEFLNDYVRKAARSPSMRRLLGKLFDEVNFDFAKTNFEPSYKRIKLVYEASGSNPSFLTVPVLAKSTLVAYTPYPNGFQEECPEIKTLQDDVTVLTVKKSKLGSLTKTNEYLESEVKAQVVRWKLSKLKDDGIDFDPVALSEAFIKEKLSK